MRNALILIISAISQLSLAQSSRAQDEFRPVVADMYIFEVQGEGLSPDEAEDIKATHQCLYKLSRQANGQTKLRMQIHLKADPNVSFSNFSVPVEVPLRNGDQVPEYSNKTNGSYYSVNYDGQALRIRSDGMDQETKLIDINEYMVIIDPMMRAPTRLQISRYTKHPNESDTNRRLEEQITCLPGIY